MCACVCEQSLKHHLSDLIGPNHYNLPRQQNKVSHYMHNFNSVLIFYLPNVLMKFELLQVYKRLKATVLFDSIYLRV